MANENDYTDRQVFTVGDRVELHPGCDLWMRGRKYGDVAPTFDQRERDELARRKVIKVKVDHVAKYQFVPADRLRKVD